MFEWGEAVSFSEPDEDIDEVEEAEEAEDGLLPSPLSKDDAADVGYIGGIGGIGGIDASVRKSSRGSLESIFSMKLSARLSTVDLNLSSSSTSGIDRLAS